MNIPVGILKNWGSIDPIRPCSDGGLINDTYIVGDPPRAILQKVNPIFDPCVHHDIEKITAHIEEVGMATPRLVRTMDDRLCLESSDGTWRMLSYIQGTTIHQISNHTQAANAAKLVGQFHRVTTNLKHDFSFARPGAHDTHLHMDTLGKAVDEAIVGPIEDEAKTLADSILNAWNRWDGEIDLPLRICHGDLKISNIRFADDEKTAVCLVDFDTFSHQTIAVEMGDAWRSWCNPAGESNLEGIRFDLGIFEASAKAWLRHGPNLEPIEHENLVLGIERICLELSARFCADAIRKSYFKEDRNRFSTPGAHNLYRAKGQFKLAQSVQQNRSKAEALIQAR